MISKISGGDKSNHVFISFFHVSIADTIYETVVMTKSVVE